MDKTRKQDAQMTTGRVLRLILAAVLALAAAASAGIAAQPDWREEFDYVCSETEHSLEIDLAELKQLLARARMLQPQIARLSGPAGKVYGKRLKMCIDLLQFVVEARMQQAEKDPAKQ